MSLSREDLKGLNKEELDAVRIEAERRVIEVQKQELTHYADAITVSVEALSELSPISIHALVASQFGLTREAFKIATCTVFGAVAIAMLCEGLGKSPEEVSQAVLERIIAPPKH